MTEAKKLIEELKKIAGIPDKESRERVNEIIEWFKKNDNDNNIQVLNEFLSIGSGNFDYWLDEMEKYVEEKTKK